MIFQHNSLLYLMGMYLMKNSYLLKKNYTIKQKILSTKLRFQLNSAPYLSIGILIKNI